MTATTVLLVIGNLTLGPFAETQQDRTWLAEANSYSSPPSTACNEARECIEIHPFKWTMKQVVCRRAMDQIGIGWRRSINGNNGSITMAGLRWGIFGDYVDVEVSCVEAPEGFRSKRYDFDYSDQVSPSDHPPRKYR